MSLQSSIEDISSNVLKADVTIDAAKLGPITVGSGVLGKS